MHVASISLDLLARASVVLELLRKCLLAEERPRFQQQDEQSSAPLFKGVGSPTRLPACLLGGGKRALGQGEESSIL